MRLLLIDDHPLVVEAMRHWLARLEDAVEILATGDCEQGLALAVQRGEPDLVLLDLNLPRLAGLPALRAWRERHPTVPVVVLSADANRDTVRAALDAGAAGFVPKSTSGDLLLAALRVVLGGGRYLPPELLALPVPSAAAAGAASARASGSSAPSAAAMPGLTERQLQVLRLVARGAPNKIIGRELGLAERTVKAHVTAVLRALNVNSRTQAALAAARMGFTP